MCLWSGGVCVFKTTLQQQQQYKTTQHYYTSNYNLIERMSRAESDFVTGTPKGPEPVRIYKG